MPAKFGEGRKTNLSVSTSDFFPTILAILGHENKGLVHPLDGANVYPFLLHGLEKRESTISFKFQNQQVIMDDQFKLYSGDEGKTYELYDLLNDHEEKKDISPENPEKVNDISLQLKKWLIYCEESNSGGDY